MKKLAILSFAFLFVLSGVSGQVQKTEKEQKKEQKKETKKVEKSERVPLKKLEGTVVSPKAKSSFASDFGTVTNVQWKRVDTFDEVTFSSDGKVIKAFYDTDGTLVGTVQDKILADIPEKGQQAIKSKYPDYTIGRVILFDDNEANETDMILYGVQFDDSDNYFVELTKGTQKIVVKVDVTGALSLFKRL